MNKNETLLPYKREAAKVLNSELLDYLSDDWYWETDPASVTDSYFRIVFNRERIEAITPRHMCDLFFFLQAIDCKHHPLHNVIEFDDFYFRKCDTDSTRLVSLGFYWV